MAGEGLVINQKQFPTFHTFHTFQYPPHPTSQTVPPCPLAPPPPTGWGVGWGGVGILECVKGGK